MIFECEISVVEESLKKTKRDPEQKAQKCSREAWGYASAGKILTT